MENWEVAAALERMAGLLALKGENDFKIRAYSQAARQVIRLTEPLAVLIEAEKLEELPGIGKALKAKIEELVSTGRSAFLARLEEEVPPGLLALFAIPGVGYKTAGALVQGLKLENMAQLEQAARDGAVGRLPGLGGALQYNILAYFAERRREEERFHRGVAVPLAEQILRQLSARPGVARCAAAGEVRRGTETVGEVLLAAVLRDESAASLAGAMRALPGITAVSRTEGGIVLTTMLGLPLRLVLVTEEAFPAALAELTGAPQHWARLVERAARLGFDLTGAGLQRAGQPVPLAEEADLYRALGLPPIPPELREDAGEMEAARNGALPELLEAGQIRGDLHLHSNWSDGTASLEEIAAAAGSLGYEYIAVTDHSPSLRIAGGLTPERLREQIGAVRRLNESGGRCRVLSGVEVDILSDGSLDLPDELLAELDLVIASVHSNFRQDRAAMTTRICRAMAHPAVQIIGHPTGRLLGSRGGYRVDVEKLIRAAAETGTILEINASPQRLDLPEAYMQEARRAGVRLAVNTDAHSTVTMEDMAYGVTAARRGWLEAGDVVNTLPLGELQRVLQEKRRRSKV